MQNYILHGDNQAKSRLRLGEIINEAREKGWEIRKIDGKTATREELLTAVRSQSLISQDQIVVIENFFSGFKDAKKVTPQLMSSSIALVIWEGKKTSPTKLSLLKGFTVEEFKIPAAIFSFLDSLSSENTAASLKLLQKAKEQDSSEFLLFMLAQRARVLFWAKEDIKTLNLPPWQKDRVVAQSKKWKKEQLLELHAKLLELDRANKRSQLPENLSASLDLLVASL